MPWSGVSASVEQPRATSLRLRTFSGRAWWKNRKNSLLCTAATLWACTTPPAPIVTDTTPTDTPRSDGPASTLYGAESSRSADANGSSTNITAQASSLEVPTVTSAEAGDDPALRVTGRVIDFWEHPVPNTPIQLGDRETTTNAEGVFTFEGVPQKYDLALAVRILGEVNEVYAWQFVGLSRRDPTLQIYKGLSQHTTPFSVSVSGFNVDARWRGEVGLGGQHGQRSYPLGATIETVAGWRGPRDQSSPLRVLLWNTTEEAPSTPSQYLFTDAKTVSLSDTQASTVELAIPTALSPLPTFEVGFTTTNAPDTSHLATSYVRFDQGPSIQVAQVPRLSETTEPFSILAPQLVDTSVTLAALSGNGANSTSFVITYAPRLIAPQTVALTFPSVAALDAPIDAAVGVTSSTPFTWSDTAGTYLVVFEDLAVYQTVFVVTSEPQVTVPDLKSLGIYYPHDGPYRWTVESHGVAEDIDQLCAAGYLDPFSGDFLYPIGPRAGEGRFWRTEARTFEFD